MSGKLQWTTRADRSGGVHHVARRGARTYVVGMLSPAAHDGDGLVTVFDGSYKCEAWALAIWDGDVLVKNPATLFDTLDNALAAAQDTEDTVWN